MSQFFTAAGAVLLIFCAIWAYSWLEVWRDPKRELLEFYDRHLRTKTWVSLINKSWLPTLVIGFFCGSRRNDRMEIMSAIMWRVAA